MAIVGEITVNEILILEIDELPTVEPIDAPIGSLAIMTDGSEVFHKFGLNSSDWAVANNTNSIVNSLIFG